MHRSPAQILIAAVIAVVVPALALHFATADDRLAAGLTAAPFAWPRLFVGHLVAAVPLGLLVAVRLRAAFGLMVAPGIWFAIAAAIIGLVGLVGPAVSAAAVETETSPLPLLLARVALSALLVTACCTAMIGEGSATTPLPNRWAITVALLIAIVPPGVYSDVLMASRTRSAEELIESGRYARASNLLLGLCEAGSDTPIRGRSPVAVRSELEAMLPRLRAASRSPLPRSAGPAEQLRRALVLLQLDHLDDAAALLEPLAESDITATLLLAAVFRDQERWAESDARYRMALERSLPVAANQPPAREAALTAIEGLLFNARAERRPADVEALLKRVLAELPAEAARFHFLLGKHYQDAGRPRLALQHLETSAQLDSARYAAPAEAAIRQIRTHTYGCVLPVSSSSSSPR